MAANTNPIFSLTPHVGWGTTALTTSNTAKDGTGTVLGCFTAGANGSFVQKIRFKAIGTNIQTVVRIFINNGSTNATPANNIYYGDYTLPASTLSENSAQQDNEYPLNFAIQAGYIINVTLGTTVSAGYVEAVVGGDY